MLTSSYLYRTPCKVTSSHWYDTLSSGTYPCWITASRVDSMGTTNSPMGTISQWPFAGPLTPKQVNNPLTGPGPQAQPSPCMAAVNRQRLSMQVTLFNSTMWSWQKEPATFGTPSAIRKEPPRPATTRCQRGVAPSATMGPVVTSKQEP